MKKLILASQSPRRSEILKNSGYQFVPFPVYVSEIPDKNLSLDDQISDIARRKAKAAAEAFQAQSPGSENSVILAADTMVCFNGQALGKPEDEGRAFEYLKSLSGKTHEVKTALYLIDLSTGETLSHVETTQVHFRELGESEIRDYIATGEPMDKAGAYAIQGLGGRFVEKFSGDYDNVVGLPLHALEKLFKLKAWNFPKAHDFR